MWAVEFHHDDTLYCFCAHLILFNIYKSPLLRVSKGPAFSSHTSFPQLAAVIVKYSLCLISGNTTFCMLTPVPHAPILWLCVYIKLLQSIRSGRTHSLLVTLSNKPSIYYALPVVTHMNYISLYRSVTRCFILWIVLLEWLDLCLDKGLSSKWIIYVNNGVFHR
jgi:hypothetical protein